MGKQTLLEMIKGWLAGKCWKYFLKLNNITEDEYFKQIQEQPMIIKDSQNIFNICITCKLANINKKNIGTL